MKKILIIEDEELLSSSSIDMLANNFEVTKTEDGLTGLQLARQLQPNFIICEANMPRFSGYEVLEALRKSAVTEKIPVILIVEKSDFDYHRNLRAGANGYAVKKSKVGHLLEAIANNASLN
ncbi:MAG: response regulator [Oscillatoriaceae cyanobacterium Prado104]|jgi:DNA-binding NarL/FixJ family response regulator|nr:response regulator [Oscillatoriaceae cyanobacterium Prado104]